MKQETLVLLSTLGVIVPNLISANTSTMNDEQTSSPSTQTIESGSPIKPNQLPAGYNYPANPAVSKGYGVGISADYIYWMASQEDMFVAEKVNGANLTELLFKPRYNSGFKVGLGWDIPNWDHWNVSAEYTWYHANMHSNFSGDPKVPMGNPEMKSKMTQSLIAAPVSNGAVIIAPVPTATLANQCNNPALPCISSTTSPFRHHLLQVLLQILKRCRRQLRQ